MEFPRIIIDILFPKRCVGCGKLGAYFCDRCTKGIHFTSRQICPVCERQAIDGMTHFSCKTRYSLDGLTSFFHYEGVIRQAVKLLKYRFVSDLAKEFISLIPFSYLQPVTHNLQPTTLIPIPLHPSRLRFRGFNQAEVLGHLFAAKLDVPIKTDLLARNKKTTPQVEVKDRKKRLKNMQNVFSVSPNILLSSYPNIILFDDVFTTGATLRSAANVLKRAGVKKVWGIVMAHG